MAYINRFVAKGKSYTRLVDDVSSLQPEKLWKKAHSTVMQSINPEDRETISNKRLKELFSQPRQWRSGEEACRMRS